MSSRVSAYQAGLWIAELALEDLWWAVFDGNPHTTDPLAIEINGGTYVRPDTPLTSYGPTGLTNDGEVGFHALPPGAHITHVGLMDAAVNGNMRAAARLVADDGVTSAPVSLPGGGTWIVPDGEFVVGIDVPGLP